MSPRRKSTGAAKSATPSAREILLGGRPIVVAPGLLDRAGELVRKSAPAHRYALISDWNVQAIYAAKVAGQFEHLDVLTIPPGESNKTRDTWSRLSDQMLAKGFGRDSTVIALGGGVVGDLAGFVAATFMRGIPVVQIPTTLVAMVDASIGGKTAVDTFAGKNLIGAFHPPATVLVDPHLLTTLPLRELRAGFAEVIKYGVIADEPYLREVAGSVSELLSARGAVGDRMLSLIVRSVEIKAGIVSRDEREEGLRKILNFGHTIGHAVELLSGFSLLHGEAVAIGMALESELAERMGLAKAGTSETVKRTLDAAGLPTGLPSGFEADDMIEAMRSDKKVRSAKIRLALPSRIGAMAGEDTGWTVTVDDAQLREVLG